MVNSAIFTIVFACIIAIVIVGTNSKKANTELALAEKTEKLQNQEEQSTPKALTEIKAREPNTNNFTYVTSEDGIQVPVPKGYVASSDVEERYVHGVTTDGVREHHGGFVIYERLASDMGKTDEEVKEIIAKDLDVAQRTRNQWVWVPIADVADMYHVTNGNLYGNTYTFSASSYSKSTGNSTEPALTNFDDDRNNLKQYLEGINRNEFLQEMREEFYNMLKSVAMYGGFYIGRYETGNISSKEPVVKKGNSTIGSVPWYRMYKVCKNLRRSNKAVQTGMIWGIQWDETLKWLIDSGEKTYVEVGRDSTSWGNYKATTFTYTNANGATLTKSGTALIPTGAAEHTKANNIYDLAGNGTEFSIETCEYGKYQRGGGSDAYRLCTLRRKAWGTGGGFFTEHLLLQ